VWAPSKAAERGVGPTVTLSRKEYLSGHAPCAEEGRTKRDPPNCMVLPFGSEGKGEVHGILRE